MELAAHRSNLVSITLFVPYEGVPHAGGEYVKRHYQALAENFDVRIIAPGSGENRKAAAQNASVAGEGVLWLGPIYRVPLGIINVVKFFRGVSLGIDLEWSLTQNSQVRDLLAGATVIEFQWTESASLARRVRAIAPNAKFIVVAHDIVSQRWQREASTGRLARRLLYTGRAFFSRLAERRRFRSVDTVIVFSEKDAELARNIAPGCNVHVVNPPLLDLEMTVSRMAPDRNGRTVLFTGAFSRPENHEAAMWLLRDVWPSVIEAVPDANLIFAGAEPLPDLESLVKECPSAILTGYVPSLAPYYRDADIFVAPLLHGAGVKFKNITAMLWQLPILTTPVGAEGIGSQDHYLGVTDNAESFAALLTRALKDSSQRKKIASQAHAWAQGRFGADQFKMSLQLLYLDDNVPTEYHRNELG